MKQKKSIQTMKRTQIISGLCVLSALMLMINIANADVAQHDIPGVSAKGKIYEVPENLTSMPTNQVSELRDTHQETLDKALEVASSKKTVEQNMLDELMEHDLVRLEIIEVIPQLINDYNINGEFKEDLMGYRSTFSGELMESREDVTSLGDYQSYDFRFASVYMSMLFAFQEHPEFYEQLKVDMVDENSSIGSYRKMLDESYDEVEEARAEMDLVNSVADIERVVDALNAELARRSN
ncbi:MAG: hypothetical protein AAGB35_08365 [Pseudomonadota bacterium]